MMMSSSSPSCNGDEQNQEDQDLFNSLDKLQIVSSYQMMPKEQQIPTSTNINSNNNFIANGNHNINNSNKIIQNKLLNPFQLHQINNAVNEKDAKDIFGNSCYCTNLNQSKNKLNSYNFYCNKINELEHKIHHPNNIFKKRRQTRKLLKEPVLKLIENCIHENNLKYNKNVSTLNINYFISLYNGSNNIINNNNNNNNNIGNLNKIDYKSLLSDCASLSLTPTVPHLYKTKTFTELENAKIVRKQNKITIEDDRFYDVKPIYMNNTTTTTLTTTMASFSSLSPSYSSLNLPTSLCTSTTSSSSSSSSSSLTSSSSASTSSASCSQQARINEINCDVTIDELACYFETLVHIPKKMSSMAEMMYI